MSNPENKSTLTTPASHGHGQADLEAQLNHCVAQLEAANKELEAFSYSVSHDLRAPLRAIDGFSRILMQDHAAQLDPTGRRYLEIVSQSAKQMGQLIDDLLAFSRLNRKALELREVDLRRLTAAAFDELVQMIPDRKIEFILADLPTVIADEVLLRQAMGNLLSNGIKFTRGRPAPRIEVGCQPGNGAPVLFVRDNGVGFDMQYAQKLFGVFQRLHRAEDFEGTGVGLAMVQRILHRHGGKVWAEASVNEGATFFFTLQNHTPANR